ncbi:MAG: hypothetical protein ACUZ8I_11785 [Candidatus Scalindua sp.]
MKVIWASPTFENTQTGCEKGFKYLVELLNAKGTLMINTYRENKEYSGLLRKLFVNFRNFMILVSQDKHAPILQNLYNRPEYFMANFTLFFCFKSKDNSFY